MRCTYNGYTFGHTAETVAFSLRPNLDASGRTVKDVTYRISVRERITDALTTDAIVVDAIRMLSKSGGRLWYKGRGFGDIEINVQTNIYRDVSWGPHTISVACVAVGAGKAVDLTWEVEFTTVNCEDAETKAGSILSFNYSISYAIDDLGYTTRNYTSTLVVAGTRISPGDKRQPFVADFYRDKTLPAIPKFFARTSQSFNSSLDKLTLTTSVTDTQLPPQLPPVQAVKGSVDHSWVSEGWTKWTATLAATYDIVTGGDVNSILNSFSELVKYRVAIAKRMVVGTGVDFDAPPNGAPPKGAPVVVIPVSATISEPNIHGKPQVRISLSYMAAGIGLYEIMRSGGLFRYEYAPTEAKWDVWFKSVQAAMLPRGSAMLALKVSDDSIIDACGQSTSLNPGTNPTKSPAPTVATLQDAELRAGQFGDDSSPGFFSRLAANIEEAIKSAFPKPTPNGSWLHYEIQCRITAETGRMVGNCLPNLPLPLSGANSRSGAWNVMGPLPAGPPADRGPFPPLIDQLYGSLGPVGGQTFYQQRVRPILYVTITGRALRVGYEIPCPELVTINGKKPVLVGQPWFESSVVASTMTPIYRATWSLTYAFIDGPDPAADGNPTKAVPTPPNPFLS